MQSVLHGSNPDRTALSRRKLPALPLRGNTPRFCPSRDCPVIRRRMLLVDTIQHPKPGQARGLGLVLGKRVARPSGSALLGPHGRIHRPHYRCAR
jgi:hypothetical protein